MFHNKKSYATFINFRLYYPRRKKIAAKKYAALEYDAKSTMMPIKLIVKFFHVINAMADNFCEVRPEVCSPKASAGTRRRERSFLKPVWGVFFLHCSKGTLGPYLTNVIPQCIFGCNISCEFVNFYILSNPCILMGQTLFFSAGASSCTI